jgi:hypothetical protein
MVDGKPARGDRSVPDCPAVPSHTDGGESVLGATFQKAEIERSAVV